MEFCSLKGIPSNRTDLAFSGIVGPETGPGKFTGPVLSDQTGPGKAKLHPSLLNTVHTATNASLFLQILVMVNFDPP